MAGPISRFHLLSTARPVATATHAGEATVLLLDHQVHPCLACLFMQFSRKLAMREMLHDCKHVNTANWSDKSEKN